MYSYTAKVVRVIDGDTVVLDVDAGFYLRYQQSFRLAGINAPEMNIPTGLAAKEFVESILPIGSMVQIRTTKGDKYGRWLASITLTDGTDLAGRIVEAGHAIWRVY